MCGWHNSVVVVEMTITEISNAAAPLLAELREAYWLSIPQYKQIENLIARNEIEQAADLFRAWRP